MGKRKYRGKTIHGLRKWKLTIILSVSLLRLRFSPSVPFHEIARLLQTSSPEHISKLAKRRSACAQGNDDTTNANADDGDTGQEDEWLPQALEDMFRVSEGRQTWLWQAARDLDASAVWQFAVWVGLLGDLADGKGGAYGVSMREEVHRQIRWRAENDWREGSVPLLESAADEQQPRKVGIIGEGRASVMG
ncbi:hypothetical protein PVAG01_03591 [Phlyctema vagabunda]|uniref:Uncharacterized protein n=1 Tax=Phlyctema vagabunda TaxID=108571 RepID=A0ABR4PLZ3_9HELO